MSADAVSLERPPSYDAKEMVWPPTILVLAGQSIHAEESASPALYQLNRGVASLTHATTEVQLERVERTVRASRGNNNDGGGGEDEPTVQTRVRHIYTLKHMHTAPGGLGGLPSDSPHYYIEAVSQRRAPLGDLGLKKAHFWSSCWTAVPVDVTARNNSYALPQFVKNGQPVFEIRSQKDGTYRWSNSEGTAIAVQDHSESQHRLIIIASLPHRIIDALVALWCCRLWQYSAEHAEPVHEGLEGVCRKFRLAKEVPAHGSTFLTKK